MNITQFKDNHKPVVERLRRYAPNKKIYQGILTIIGEEVGLSRERVRQIAKALGYQPVRETTKQERTKNCVYCGKRFIGKDNRSIYCCRECRDQFNLYKYYTLDVCIECGFAFLNYTSQGRKHKLYCSKTCHGKHVAKIYGWGTLSNPMKRLYPSIEQILIDFPEAFTTREFAKKYGYTSQMGAYRAIYSLRDKDLVETYRVRGLYRVKSKAIVDKSL